MSFATSEAASTPEGEPAITTWPGALKLATHTSSSTRWQALSTRSSSKPRMAAIVPSCASAHTCIASPRSETSKTASSKSRHPDAVSAEYSPRLCPACAAASTPIRWRASKTTIETRKVDSCAFRVCVNSSSPASRRRAFRSLPVKSAASATNSHEGWSTHSAPIPVFCDPCPG